MEMPLVRRWKQRRRANRGPIIAELFLQALRLRRQPCYDTSRVPETYSTGFQSRRFTLQKRFLIMLIRNRMSDAYIYLLKSPLDQKWPYGEPENPELTDGDVLVRAEIPIRRNHFGLKNITAN